MTVTYLTAFLKKTYIVFVGFCVIADAEPNRESNGSYKQTS
ncbi:protein of unknown function [Methylocaldum szegediense]|uniref:Uncharacterized protein n=1 Tax=Methylocaldum szegediense TaxID=73780 RepID=A0ABM9I7I5_9GAMM|nr:protein of unknown function [Methylocaldum szegediense]